MGGMATNCWSSEEQGGSQARVEEKKEGTGDGRRTTEKAAAVDAPPPLFCSSISSFFSLFDALGWLSQRRGASRARVSRKEKRKSPRAFERPKQIVSRASEGARRVKEGGEA